MKQWFFADRNIVRRLLLVNVVVFLGLTLFLAWRWHQGRIAYQRGINHMINLMVNNEGLSRHDAKLIYNRPQGRRTMSNSRLQGLIAELKSRTGENHNLKWAVRAVTVENGLASTEYTSQQMSMLSNAFLPLLRKWPGDPRAYVRLTAISMIGILRIKQLQPEMIGLSHSKNKRTAELAKESLVWMDRVTKRR